jgi:hypothetical protein
VNDASNALQSEVRGKAAVRTHYMPFRLPEAQHAQEGPRSNHFGDINRKVFRRIVICPNLTILTLVCRDCCKCQLPKHVFLDIDPRIYYEIVGLSLRGKDSHAQYHEYHECRHEAHS